MDKSDKLKTIEFEVPNSMPVFENDWIRLQSMFKRFTNGTKLWELIFAIAIPLVFTYGTSLYIYDGNNQNIKSFYLVSLWVSIFVSILSFIAMIQNKRNDRFTKEDIEELINEIFARGIFLKPKSSISNSTNSELKIDKSKHDKVEPIIINIPKGTPQLTLIELNKLLQANKGNTKSSLLFTSNVSERVIDLPFGLNWNSELESEIKKVLNSGS